MHIFTLEHSKTAYRVDFALRHSGGVGSFFDS